MSSPYVNPLETVKKHFIRRVILRDIYIYIYIYMYIYKYIYIYIYIYIYRERERERERENIYLLERLAQLLQPRVLRRFKFIAHSIFDQ